MESTHAILDRYGKIGVEALKQDVQPYSATNKTVESIRYELSGDATYDRIQYLARAFFSTLESGRGPRRSSEQGEFLEGMLEYMRARGIGAELDEKKRKQLARFLTLKINREGDETFKRGGRIVYSPTLTKLADEIKTAVLKDFRHHTVTELKNAFKG